MPRHQTNARIDGVGMKQHINKATHKSGHTLDALITREVDNIISGPILVEKPNLWGNVKCEPAGDHNAMIFHINNDTIKHNPVSVEYRKLRTIDVHAFNEDIITKLSEPEQEATFRRV